MTKNLRFFMAMVVLLAVAVAPGRRALSSRTLRHKAREMPHLRARSKRSTR